jgi:dihydroorotase
MRIRAALADGTIDAICSDHAPVDDDAKALPFAEAEPGVTGLELLLPLTLKWAQEDRVPLASALARISNRRPTFSASRRAALHRARPPTCASSTPRPIGSSSAGR